MPLSDHERRMLDDIGSGLTRTRRVGLLKPGPGALWRALLWSRAAAPTAAVLILVATGVMIAALLMPAAVAAVACALFGALGVLAVLRTRERLAPTRR